MTTNRTPWTPAENAALVRLYFDMLDCATAGCAYNKAAMIRSYQATDDGRHPEALANRSRGSVEAKLMNASACHADLINDHIERYGSEPTSRDTMHGHGYRCLSNYQAALKDAMRDEIERRAGRDDSLAIRTVRA